MRPVYNHGPTPYNVIENKIDYKNLGMSFDNYYGSKRRFEEKKDKVDILISGNFIKHMTQSVGSQSTTSLHIDSGNASVQDS